MTDRRTVDTINDDQLSQLYDELDQARMWARHGYEIGQLHCGWFDHGVAPDWLTEGWPPHFDSCQHLKRASEYDTALTRVRDLADRIRQGAPWTANDDDIAAHILRALDGDQTPPEPPVHVGGGANAEDCPACTGTNPDYPFICPGPDAEQPARTTPNNPAGA